VTGAYDILQPGSAVEASGGPSDGPPRVVIALHQADLGARSELAATLLDVRTPDAARTKFFTGLLLRGLP